MTDQKTAQKDTRDMFDVFLESLEGADRVIVETRNALGEMDAHYMHAPEIKDAISTRADLAPMVKPLAWCGYGDGYKSASPVGEYQAHPTANTRNQKFVVYCVCVKGKSWTVGYADGAQAAKAAAQADYERRILSALIPAPITLQQAVDALLPLVTDDVADDLKAIAEEGK